MILYDNVMNLHHRADDEYLCIFYITIEAMFIEIKAPKADHEEANTTVSQIMMIYCLLVTHLEDTYALICIISHVNTLMNKSPSPNH